MKPTVFDMPGNSDSFSYADRRIACPEQIPAENALPDLLTARKTALNLLDQNRLLLPQMRMTDPGATHATGSEKCGGEATPVLTEPVPPPALFFSFQVIVIPNSPSNPVPNNPAGVQNPGRPSPRRILAVSNKAECAVSV